MIPTSKATDKDILYIHMKRELRKRHSKFAMWCYERIFALEGLELKNGWLIGEITPEQIFQNA